MSGSQPTAVVMGAGRGLGLEFARQLAQRDFRVLGTVRKASPALEETGAVQLELDVSDAEAIAAFPGQVRQHCEGVDLPDVSARATTATRCASFSTPELPPRGSPGPLSSTQTPQTSAPGKFGLAE